MALARKTICPFVALISILLWPSFGGAVDNHGNEDDFFGMSLAELTAIPVVTTSRSLQAWAEAPGIVTVITAEEIAAFGARDLAEVLDRTTSTQSLHYGRLFYNVVSIRDQALDAVNRSVLVMINGRALREGVSGGLNAPIYQSFPLEAISRIEIVRGPGSVLYGTNAFSGAINIITKTGEEVDKATSSLALGSYRGNSQSWSVGWREENDSAAVYGSRAVDDGPEFAFTDRAGTYESTEFSRDRLGIFSMTEMGNFSTNICYFQLTPVELQAPLTWQGASDDDNRKSLFMVSAGYYGLSSPTLQTALDLSYTHYDFQFRDIASDDVLLEGSVNGQLQEDTGYLVGGMLNLSDFEGESVRDGHLWKGAAFCQLDHRPVPSLKLIAGGQINKPESFDTHFSPRLGAVGQFTPRSGFKLLYNDAFRDPYPVEVTPVGTNIVANPDLAPETISTMEAQIFMERDLWQGALTIYHSDMKEMIVKTSLPDGRLQYLNTGEHCFRGIELEGKIHPCPRLTVIGNFWHQRNENAAGVLNSAAGPETMLKVGMIYGGNLFSMGLHDSYFGARVRVADITGDTATVPVNPEPRAYHRVSANLRLNLAEVLGRSTRHQIEVSLYVDNILDEEVWVPELSHQEVNSLPLLGGRTFQAGVGFTF